MLMQNDLFEEAEATDAIEEVADPAALPIAVPCGFRDRQNNPCQRRGNWPIMDGGKQMLCRDRPMVHCDAACFRGDPPAPVDTRNDDDIVWGDEGSGYGDIQSH